MPGKCLGLGGVKMNKTKKVVLLGILTALYVVLSFCVNYPRPKGHGLVTAQ